MAEEGVHLCLVFDVKAARTVEEAMDRVKFELDETATLARTSGVPYRITDLKDGE